MHKKSFTLIEVLIVMMIIGVFFVMFRYMFQVNNKNTLYDQSCMDTIYGETNNFISAGLSSKMLFSSGAQIFPTQYIVSFAPNQQTISLRYNTGTTYKTIEFSGNLPYENCTQKSSIIIMSGDTYDITISKKPTGNAFALSGTPNTSTGGNIFFSCTRNNGTISNCKHITTLQTDKRTMNFIKQNCLSFTGNDCREWDN